MTSEFENWEGWDFSLKTEEEEKAKVRVKEAKKKKEVAKFEPTWEQVWNGYEKPVRKKNPETGKMEDVMVKKKGIWEMADSRTTHRHWLQEVKDAVEAGEIGLTSPTTGQDIPVGKFSKSSAKELYAVLEEQKRVDRIKYMVDNCPDNYFLITEENQMDKLVGYLEDEEETGLDSETTGLDVYLDVMVGLSITLPKKNIHVYVPFGHETGEKQLPREYVLSKLEPYLRGDSKKFLHNAKFDKHMFIRHGYDIEGFIHCTQIAMKLLNENEMSFRLKDLLTKYKRNLGFEEDSYTFEQLFGKKAEFHKVPLDVAMVYACKDTHGCYLLGKWQESFFRTRKGISYIFYDVEAPLMPIVVDMERTGMLVDFKFADVYEPELRGILASLEKEIRKELGDVNLNSPAQMAVWLYDKQGLDDISGKRKTDKKTLEALSEDCPVLKIVLKYKDLFKLHSTYISALPEKVKADGRVHGQFNQDKTDTGRFSSQEPNLQNLPGRARKLFVAPEGKVVWGIDFSQIEPRFLAHTTQDPELMKPYMEGYDLYSTLASRVFKVPIEQCGDGSKYRKMMKTGLLAVMYGTSMFTLSKQLGISVQEAEQFIKDFYKAYPKVQSFIEGVWEFVKENEFVECEFGRKRRFPGHRQQAVAYDKCKQKILKILKTDTVPQDFWDKKKYPYSVLPYNLKRSFQDVKGSVERVRRQAVNFLIQGAAATIMKIAMIRLDEVLKKYGWDMMATVHDEALAITDINITHDQIIELNEAMRTAVELAVPLKTDVEGMLTWGNGIKFDASRRIFYHKNEKTGETLFESADLKESLKYIEEVA